MEIKKGNNLSIEQIEEGVYNNVSVETYNRSAHLRRSSIVNILKSPKYYEYKLYNKSESTTALNFGIAFHCAVLEPHLWDNVIISPDVGTATKKYKEFVLANPDRIVVTPKDLALINDMSLELNNNAIAKELLKSEYKELTAYASILDIKVKARADIALPEEGILVDLKTARGAHHDDFQRSCATYMYDLQAGFYLTVFNKALKKETFHTFLFLVIEKERPFHIQIYSASNEFVKSGVDKTYQAIAKIKECLKNNYFGEVTTEIVNLDLPRWAQ